MEKKALQKYLSDGYQGWESFYNTVIFPIFGDEMYDDEQRDYTSDWYQQASSVGIKSIIGCGRTYVGGEPLFFFDITVSDKVLMERNKVNIRKVIFDRIEHYSNAFMIFHYEGEDKWQWRFSYCYKKQNNTDSTDRKRFTFLLGKGQSCRTAAENFYALYEKHQKDELIEANDLINAFNVEALSQEFFDKYREQYANIIYYITGKRMVKVKNKWEERQEGEPDEVIMQEFSHFPNPEKAVRDYVKKLMGRLVFLQFLQKKGWLGVRTDAEWGTGDPNFIQNIFAQTEDKDHFVDNVLEALFNDLNSEDEKQLSQYRTPFLNGGLFERDASDETNFPLPAKYMQQMLDFFSSYNFTIDENDPNDAEVGVDPEMLGRIFENLLEDNKDKGAFYTPKEIVTYMCRESLIAYLQTDVEDEKTKEAIRQFVSTHDATTLGNIADDIDQRLKDVKICDPAIGSGAFPMGLLKELFFCRTALEDIEQSKAAEIKKHIIQQNIYGVDIEKGAVDIARLRFWISLIVDEETPQALPNLDFKIMHGNSLLEQYKGADLSKLLPETVIDKQIRIQATFFDEEFGVEQKQLQDLLNDYYGCCQPTRKKELKEDISRTIQQQIHDRGIRVDFGDINLAGNNQFFLWHTWFHDVFVQGGFDIVIGNPPYIDSETMVKVMPKERELYAQKYTCASGNWDMFIVFIELGISLLKENGIFSNIFPNKLIAAKYGMEIRKHLSSKHVIEIRDYSRIDVFEDAAVYPITIVLRNNNYSGVSLFTIMQNRIEIKQSNIAKSSELLKNDYWDPFFTDTPIFKLVSKINNLSRLKELPVEVLGAATVADAYKIKELVQDNPNIDGFKLVNSGTIDPYATFWGIKQCRYIKGSYIYPKVPTFELKNYSEVRCEQASSPKIIVASMTTKYEAFLDIAGEYIAGKSTTIIRGARKELYNLTAIVNSKLASFWLNVVFNSLKMSGGAINIGKNELQNLPIPKGEYDFESQVQQILDMKLVSHLNDTSTLESEIDRFVYQLYGLTEEEIKIVEGCE